MNRAFYSCAIFFTGLYLLISIVWCLIYFQQGDEVISLPSIDHWLFLQFLVLFVWSFILLKYYNFKKYRFTFWLEVAFLLGTFIQFLLFQYFFVTYELAQYHYHTHLLLNIIGVLYGVSLILSRAGRRVWLKGAGIILILTGLVRMVFLVLIIISPNPHWNILTGEIDLWLSWIGTLVPVFFIFNFWEEWKTAEKEDTHQQGYWVGALYVVGFVALISTILIGQRVSNESLWISKNPDFVPEKLEELAKPFEARIYVNKQGDTLRFRLMKPRNYEADKGYPLVVSLHGSNGRGTDNAKQIATSLTPHLLPRRENREKYPAFLFVPQCPPGTWWGGISGQSEVDSLLIECILSLEEEFTIDKNRRYVTGVSMGGYGAWHLIGTRPDFFAAAIPICGEGNPELASNMKNVPIWAFHGANDGYVPVSGSRNMIEAIRKAGGNPKYTEYPDEAHNLFEQINKTPELLDWLFEQDRGQKGSETLVNQK